MDREHLVAVYASHMYDVPTIYYYIVIQSCVVLLCYVLENVQC